MTQTKDAAPVMSTIGRALARHFVHRSDTFVTQTSRGGYVRAIRPVRATTIEDHVEGLITVALYLIDPADQTVRIGALDLDILKEAILKRKDEGLSDEEILRIYAKSLCKLARDAAAELKSLGLTAQVEFSGQRGLHVIVICDSPVPAVAMHRVMLEVSQRLIDRVPADLSVEVFPSHTEVRRGAFDKPLKLPGGLHRRSGRRSRFLRAVEPAELLRDRKESDFLAEQAALVSALQVNRAAAVVAASRTVKITDVQAGRGSASTRSRTHRTQLSPGASADRGSPGPHATAVFSFADLRALRRGCAVVARLERRARSVRNLSHEERKLLARILLPMGQLARDYLHVVLGTTANYDMAKTESHLNGLTSIDGAGLPRYPTPTCATIRRSNQSTCRGCTFFRSCQGRQRPRPFDLALRSLANRLADDGEEAA